MDILLWNFLLLRREKIIYICGDLVKLSVNSHLKNSMNYRKSLLIFSLLVILCQYAFAASILPEINLDEHSSPITNSLK